MPEQNNDKLLSKEELRNLEDLGYTPRGAGFAKDNKFVSKTEIDELVARMREEQAMREARDQYIEDSLNTLTKKVSMITGILARNAARVKEIENSLSNETDKEEGTGDTVFKESLSALQGIKDSVSSINSSLVKINRALTDNKAARLSEEYMKEEGGLETKPIDQTPVREPKGPTKEGGPSFGSLLKDFFTNPAVIAAFSGIVYMFLPKDVKEKIGAFFKGFSEGGNRTISELTTLEKAIAAAGIALATFLGAKFISSIADAASTLISLIAKAKDIFGSLRKGGAKKAAGELAKKAITSPGVVAGAVGLGTLAVMSSQEEAPAATPVPESKPLTASTAPAAEAPTPAPSPVPQSSGAPAQAPIPTPTPSSGTSLKPSGGLGIKPPVMSGEDGPIMDMIKRHEGVRTRPYKDSLGLWTVGVGHLIGDGKTLPPEMNREFSMEEVNTMFIKDYKHHKEAAQKIPGYDKTNSNGKAALIDLTFNMGPTWFKKWPNFTRSASTGDGQGAASSLENSKWYTQVGNRARTIVSMMRNGFGGQNNQGTQMAAATRTSTMSETAPSSKGEALNKSSMGVESASSGRPEVITSSVDNSNIKKGKEGIPPPPSIPSPIANRDSLNTNNKHSTAYA
jgi:lysozyme